MAYFSTRSIHVGSEPDPISGAVVPDISVATTFKQDGVGKHRGHEYSRLSNPTRSALETLIASLETGSSTSPSSQLVHGNDDQPLSDLAADHGQSFVFASGSAATAAMCHWVTLAADEGGAGGRDGVNGGGGHVLAVNDVYGGTERYFTRAAKSTGLEITFLDMEKVGEVGIRCAIRPDTKLIWIETPTNPTLGIPPLRLIRTIVDSIPNETRPLILIDTTFLSPFNITPLIPSLTSPDSRPLGDVILTSLSKYSSGHSDIILGSLTVSATTKSARPTIAKGLGFLQNAMGATASPRDCHLMIRSLKTLSVRVMKHGLNAIQIAAFLRDHPEVEHVRYPGLTTDQAFPMIESLLASPAKKELEFLGWEFPYSTSKTTNNKLVNDHPTSNNKSVRTSLEFVRSLGIPFGGMISFRLCNATAQQTDEFVTNLQYITLAESLGGVESLVEVPAMMTHAGLPEATRNALGITPNLIRLSVGIEDVDDLISDLSISLDRFAANKDRTVDEIE